MFLAYLKRFDMSCNSYVYTVSAIGAYTLGCMGWLTVMILNIRTVTLAIFVYPVMLLTIFFISFSRK